MKFNPHSSSSAASRRLILVLASLVPLFALAAPPAWWMDRQVLDTNAAKNDYGPANVGQLKNIASKAYAELQSKLPASTWSTPEGQALGALISSWNAAQVGNYAAINQGQLKAVAKMFYDVLIQAGYTSGYPWTAGTSDDANYSPANIGQVKNLFSFDLVSIDSSHDTNQNGLPDWWEKYYFGYIGVNPIGDANGNGISNLQEFLNGTAPVDGILTITLTEPAGATPLP